MRSSAIRIEMIAAVAVTLAVALNSSGQTPPDASVRELIRKARGSIVTITGENRAGEPVPAALGFVIDDKLVATSYRILPMGAQLHVNPSGQESARSNVSYSDGYRVAMIMTMPSWLRLDALAMGDSDKVIDNDRVYFYADPDPQVEAVEATVKRVTGSNDKRTFELSAPIKPGAIGGPLFNGKGEVIGILCVNYDVPEMGRAVPTSYLKVLLKARNPEPTVGLGQGSDVKPMASSAGGAGASSSGSGGVGVGAGDGSGVGPGRSPSVGPGLPSLGPGAGTGSIGSRPSTPTPVTTRPKQLNTPRPRYTEVARMNQTMGVVMLRLMVGADGTVKRVAITKGLPDGLDDQALKAAFELKFEPATRDGVAVDYMLSILVEFNLR